MKTRQIALLFLLCLLITTPIGVKAFASTESGSPQNASEPMIGKALATYEKAQAGDAESQFELGQCYYNEIGVVYNHSKALQWYKKASSQGLAIASYVIGIMQEEQAETYKWFKLAAEQAYNSIEEPSSQYTLDELKVFEVDGKLLVKQDLLNENRNPYKWLELAAENGYPRAERKWGTLHLLKNDSVQCFNWTLKAAEDGDIDAQWLVGSYYISGVGTAKNIDEGLRWRIKVAEQGDLKAIRALGEIYYEGKLGQTKDYAESFKWYYKGAMVGDTESQYNVGYCYAYGEGVNEDKSEAIKWLRLAAEKDHSAAQWELYLAYRDGEGVEKNMDIAKQWLEKAAENEDEDAIEELGKLK